jgi:YVTN family beta-propeller protein
MLLQTLLAVLSVASAAALSCSQPPALPGAGCPVSLADRIYTGDQTSNTITVLRPYDGVVLGTLALGTERLSDSLGPQYSRAVNAHGLGFSRDGKLLVSTSVTTNTVTVIRTADNAIVSQTSVARQAHEAFFAADNATVWVATRGTDFVQLVDAKAGGVIAQVFTPGGPSKVLFSPDGSVAYANHVRAPILAIIDVATRRVIFNITGLADDFSSDFMVSPDGRQAWVAHKMIGKVSVVDLVARRVASVVDTGPETNHPNFAYINGTLHAFVTVGALNATRVYLLVNDNPTAVPVWVADVASSGVQPHGLWPSGDNTFVYVVNEHSDTMDAIDTALLRVTRTWRVGQEGQALVYVSGAVPEGSSASDGGGAAGTQPLMLGMQGIKQQAPLNARIAVTALPGAPEGGEALLTVRELSGVDMIQLIGRRLRFNATYTFSAQLTAELAACPRRARRPRVPLLDFTPTKQEPEGCATAPQVLAFIKWFGVYDADTARIEELA